MNKKIGSRNFGKNVYKWEKESDLADFSVTDIYLPFDSDLYPNDQGCELQLSRCKCDRGNTE